MKKLYRRGLELLKKTGVIGAGLDRPRRALAMAERAGRCGAASLESLEPRQLLFTLAITPDLIDPATGVGAVTADFAYYLPYLFRELPDPVNALTVLEDFGDEMAFWTMNVPPSPPNGTFFENSGIRIAYRSSQSAPAQLFLGPDQGAQGAMDRDLGIKLATTDQMTFSFFAGVDEMMPTARLALSASLTIRPGNAQNPGFIDGDGLNTDNLTGTRIELLRGGIVVQVLRGAALDAIAQPVQQGPGDTAPVLRYDINFAQGFDAVRFSSAANTKHYTNIIAYAPHAPRNQSCLITSVERSPPLLKHSVHTLPTFQQLWPPS